MGHSMASQRSEISKAMSDFKEELKELITKGMEEAIEKAMEAMRQSLADWDIERKSTADHLNVQAEDNQFPTQQQYDVPQKSYGDRHNDQHKYYVPQKSYAGDRVVPFQNGQMKLHQFQPQQEQPLPNQNQTYSVVSKSLTQMPARQVFEAKSERIFVQKASLSISKGTNPLIWPPNPCRNALNTHCNMVMVYKLHENEYGKLDSKIKNRTPKTHVVGRSLSPGIAPVSSRNALVEDQIGRNSLNHSSSMIELADVAASLSGLSLSKHDLGPLQTQLAHRLDKQSGKQPNLSNDSNGYGQSFPQSNEVSRTEKIALATNYVDLLKVKGLVADLNVVKLGLNGQANVPRRTSSYLLGPFLLLHLGGPDTITAFTTEDNELWLRHLFYLVSKCVAVAYAYYQFLQTNFILRIPTLLMFLCGIIKCAERTCALYYGSANSFRNSMLAKPDWEAIPNKEIKPLIKKDGDALSDLQVLQYAFVYFTAFKGLVVDLILSVHERNQSREFFLAVSCEDAFRLVEVELNYLYDVLFTKLSVLHHKIGYFCRTLSFFAVVASFVLYHSHHLKHHSHNDVVITYTLLIGAIVLEVIAFYMLLFTDWTVIKLKPLSDGATFNYKSWKDKFLGWILCVNNTRSVFLTWLLQLVGGTDHHPESKLTNISFLDGVWYVKPQPLTHNITSFIFEELKMKSEMAESLAMAKEIFSSKGEWVLEWVYHEMGEDLGSFVRFVANFNYDDILLVWHIATEVCYSDSQDHPTNKEQRDTAKSLSDYMLYLMVMKPDMMSAISGFGEIKFEDTCTEVSKFFHAELPELKKRKFCNFFCRESTKDKEALQRKACETILMNISKLKTLKDRDIFFTASALAEKLKVLPSDKKWLIISKLWVELLSYAASHIRTSAHAFELSKGGELITVVWLLMAHFGLGDQYEINLGIVKDESCRVDTEIDIHEKDEDETK